MARKIILLTDQHWGVRAQSPFFLQHCIDFHRNVFFPYLDHHRHEIEAVICLGDLVDHRKMITWPVAQALREHFVEPMLNRGIVTYVIPGNHDCYHKSSVDLNALGEMLPPGQNFVVYNEPEARTLANRRVLFLPWICSGNYEESMKAIDVSEDRYVFAHLELIGFEQYRGLVATHGMDPNLFNRAVRVFSGHYHHPSKKGNIQYLCAPYQMTWNDYDCPRGFHVWYPEADELELIRNPVDVFEKLTYDDSNKDSLKQFKKDFSNKIVKVVVEKRENKKLFEKTVGLVEQAGASDIQVIEPAEHVVDTTVKADEANKNTLEIILESVEEFGDDTDKAGLSNLLKELYHDAERQQV